MRMHVPVGIGGHVSCVRADMQMGVSVADLLACGG
jgi:hypothetical protein